MAKYTTELRTICEYYANYNTAQGYEKISDIIDNSWDKIFDFNFPIFDETYRKPLCTKIIKHYYTREICAETVARWKLFLDSRLNEIMDKYNILYRTINTEFSPFADVDYTREYTKHNEGSQENEGSSEVNTTGSGSASSTGRDTADSSASENVSTETTQEATSSQSAESHSEASSGVGAKSKYNDTPQGDLTNTETDRYLTNFSINDTLTTQESDGTNSGESSNSGTTTVEGSTGRTNSETKNSSISSQTQDTAHETGTQTNSIDVNNTEEYAERVFGKQGGESYSKLFIDFVREFEAIDNMIIKNLCDLFMCVY